MYIDKSLQAGNADTGGCGGFLLSVLDGLKDLLHALLQLFILIQHFIHCRRERESNIIVTETT